MKKWQLSRRILLKGTGAALALPFLDQMWPSAADAQAAPPPRRFLGWYVPCGMNMPKFTPPDVGNAYTLTPILQPLAAHRNDFLVLSGLANRPAEPHGPGHHPSGTAAFLAPAHPFRTDGPHIPNS